MLMPDGRTDINNIVSIFENIHNASLSQLFYFRIEIVWHGNLLCIGKVIIKLKYGVRYLDYHEYDDFLNIYGQKWSVTMKPVELGRTDILLFLLFCL